MRGESRAPLVEASDGFLYIVKWLQDSKTANCIRNGALRNTIYEKIGLPVTPWMAIEISTEFLNRNRLEWLGGPREKPTPGYHYGSRWAGASEETVFEMLPTTWHQRICNRSTFWAAYVADVWTLRLAPRQAIFVEDHISGNIRVVFIDHGSPFPRTRRSSSTDIDTILYSDRTLYDDSVFADQLQIWIRHIQDNGEAAVMTACRQMPAEWKSAAVEAFSEFLIRRIAGLENILRTTTPSAAVHRHLPRTEFPSSTTPFDPGLIA
jgi:hypothetical protein